MVDPITAIAGATAAFNAIKKGFEVGRDIESMYGDIGRWMSSVETVNKEAKTAKSKGVFPSSSAPFRLAPYCSNKGNNSTSPIEAAYLRPALAELPRSKRFSRTSFCRYRIACSITVRPDSSLIDVDAPQFISVLTIL